MTTYPAGSALPDASPPAPLRSTTLDSAVMSGDACTGAWTGKYGSQDSATGPQKKPKASSLPSRKGIVEQEPRPCERENRPSHGCSRILSPIFAQQAMRHVLVLCTTEAHWSRSARRTLGTGAVHAHGMDRLSLDIAAASTRRASPSPFDLYFSTFSR